FVFFFSSRRRHTRFSRDWSSDVCSSDLPDRWDDPGSFDVTRRAAGHVGFGAGIHGCAGQMLARLEIEVLLGEMAGRVASIERTGEVAWALNNTTRGLARLPVVMPRG